MNAGIAVVIAAGLIAQTGGESRRAALQSYQAGSKAFAEQQFDVAIAALEKSLELYPNELRAIRLLGLAYQLTGRFDRAETRFEDACRLAPKDAEAWFYLGRLHYVRNFFDRARSALETAVRYAPNDARIRETLGLTFEALGDSAAAEAEYRQAVRWTRNDSGTPYLNYGALLLKLDRVGESRPLLERAVALMPANWQAHFELAKLYRQQERFEAALAELTVALRCAPGTAETARTNGLMATVYSRLGRYEEARLAAAAAEK